MLLKFNVLDVFEALSMIQIVLLHFLFEHNNQFFVRFFFFFLAEEEAGEIRIVNRHPVPSNFTVYTV